MPLIERTGNSVKFNTTIPVLLWMGFFLGLAAVLGSETLMWVGLLPLLLWGALTVLLWVFGACLAGVAYLSGHEVRWTFKDERHRRK